MSARARATANPIMWVKLTFPPWVSRCSWLLIIRRLTSSSLAGMVRTEVAVGTSRLSSIRLAMVAEIPISGWISTSASFSSSGDGGSG